MILWQTFVRDHEQQIQDSLTLRGLDESSRNVVNILLDDVNEQETLFVSDHARPEHSLEDPEKFFMTSPHARTIQLSSRGVRLRRAVRWLFSKNASKFGFEELFLTSFLSQQQMESSGHWQTFGSAVLSCEKHFLTPTTEVNILNHRSDHTVQDLERYCCFSRCYRKEDGSYGRRDKYTRLREFSKMELFTFCSDWQVEYEYMLNCVVSLLNLLNLPFRLLKLSARDISPHSMKTIDAEVWVPERGYIEVSSISFLGMYQSIRSKIKNKNKEHPYTMNGTALGMERTLLAIISNGLEQHVLSLLPEGFF